MANIRAIHSVGNSVITFLRNTYPASVNGMAMPSCAFELFSCGQLAGELDDDTRIGLLLYKATVNEHAQQAHARAGLSRHTLSLDLHYLLIAWSVLPQDEQVTFAWALHQLHQHPLLDASSLSTDAGWSRDDVIQLVPSELTTEDTMRIWDALEPAYRLSASFVARVVHLEPDVDREEFARVVARRDSYGVDALPGVEALPQ